jgi:NAD(P)H-hydrate epimerase
MDLQRITEAPTPPPRPVDGHKGTFGTVIVVGGSATMIGAPAIAASAALRSGAGLVKLAAPGPVLPFAITIEPSATGIILDGDDPTPIDEADPGASAVLAIGPGLGSGRDDLLRNLLASRRRVVLDADGLNTLARFGEPARRDAALILTPHPGEFKRLAEPLGIAASPTDPDQRPDAAAALAQSHGAIVVLKGARTVVSDAKRCFVNNTGNVAMATAGSGDVLTGCVAALLAAGMDPFEAACLGVHAHGLAGDRWAQQHGPAGLKADALADQLVAAFAQLRHA